MSDPDNHDQAAETHTLASVVDRLDKVEKDLAKNTEITTEVAELLAAAKLGLRVLGWIGNGAWWVIKALATLTPLVGAAVGGWYAIRHGGQLPPKN